MSAGLDLAALSVVFISYDEPEADANFALLQAAAPRARRVHGVRGFDAAHRRAGEIADTAHVLTVDGDNVLREPDLFARRLAFSAEELAGVVSFSARVVHNGLAYGNGGVKIWPLPLLRALRTHEAARDGGAAVDFCWRIPYVQALGAPTDTHVTAAPFQAFRAGLREGARLTMHRGATLGASFPGLPPAEALRRLSRSNLERLRIWCSVGRDVENGDWAMLGARAGCALAALDGLDIDRIADFDWIARLWEETRPRCADAAARTAEIARLAARLDAELDLGVADLGPEASRFAKSIYRPPRRLGTLMPE